VVTGAAGFIGSNLTDALVEDGHDVLAVDDLSSGVEADVNPEARLLRADVADLDRMTEAFAGREVVFHQAAHR
jgi:UDP-glucose 4-epimerase